MSKAKTNKITCTTCGKEKPPTVGFYLSHSKLYKCNQGRMPVCKDCFFSRYKEFLIKYSDDEKKALYAICMQFDIYFDTKLIRPQVSSNPKMYNQHMTGRGSSKNPKDVSSLLPQWYDEGFRRGKEEIKLDILDKTKEAFPIDKIKQIVGEDLLKVATEGVQKYKK